MVVALPVEQAEALTAGLHPIEVVRVPTAAEGTTLMPSILPLAVAVSSTLETETIGLLADLARTCASEVVVIDESRAGRELIDAVLDVVRRSDARRAR
jgi:hypothetical protein